jgi:curli production assembly/transport component CsgF
MGKIGFRMALVVGVIGFLAPAFATEQVYHPVSPTLGGNPSNGTFLLSTAQAQGEGVNSGNQGPTINFPNLTTTPTTTSSSGSSGNGGTPQMMLRTLVKPVGTNTVANPLGTSSGRF